MHRRQWPLLLLLIGLVAVPRLALAAPAEAVEPLPAGGTPTPSATDEDDADVPGDVEQEDDGEQPGRSRANGTGRTGSRGNGAVLRPRKAAQEPRDLPGAQIPIAIALALVTSGLVAGVAVDQRGHFDGWKTAGLLAGGALATGLVSCVVGGSRTTSSACGFSVAGALVGMVALLPAVALAKSSSGSCTATGNNADDKCAVSGALDGGMVALLGVGGYAFGLTAGSRIGWQLGAASDAGTTTPRQVSASLLSLTF